MKIIINHIFSTILLACFIFFAVGSVDDSDSSSTSSNSSKTDSNSWTLGTWSTSSYDDIDFKLSVLKGNDARFWMLNSWYDCKYKIEGNSLIVTRNDVDMIFNLDKNKIYMAGGNELSK